MSEDKQVATMKTLLVLCLFVASTLAASFRQPRIDRNGNWRVVGGRPAEDGAHPHQISLKLFGLHGCGGSIVNAEWVITAAHCVAGLSGKYLTVVTGTNSLSSGGTSHKVVEVHSHENYDAWNIQNDVAILKVEPIDLDADNVAAIAAETEDVGGGEPVVLTGWGTTSYPGSIPDKLQEIDLNTTTVEYCQSRHSTPVINSEICTLTKSGEGACHGDSGGPLTRLVNKIRRLVGIISWVQPCARGYPDVFSRVSSFVPWFNSKCNNCLN